MDPFIILGHLDLYITIEELQKNSRFLVADTLAINILLGTAFINQHILTIQETELEINRGTRDQLLFYHLPQKQWTV